MSKWTRSHKRHNERFRGFAAFGQVLQRWTIRVSTSSIQLARPVTIKLLFVTSVGYCCFEFMTYHVLQDRGHRHSASVGCVEEPHADGRTRRHRHRSAKVHGRYCPFYAQREGRDSFLPRIVRRHPQTSYVLDHTVGHVQLVVHNYDWVSVARIHLHSHFVL